MRSTQKSKQRQERSNINYKAKFTGAVLVKPLMFNPTADQIREIKQIPEQFDVKEPNYKREIKGEEYSVVNLLCSYNPNEALGLEKQAYGDTNYVNYRIHVANKDAVGSKSGKTQIIDEHNQSAWILLKGKKSLAAQIKEAQKSDSPYSDGDSVRKIDPDTARVAKIGEVALYNLVFDMSVLDAHKPDKEEPENLDKGTHLHEFKLGENPTETFQHICEGEVSALNMLLETSDQDFEGKEFFVGENGQNSLGLFLGVREYDDKLIQTVAEAPTFFNVSTRTTFRELDRSMEYDEHGSKEVSQINKELYKMLIDEDYPWGDFWSNSLSFKEVTLEEVQAANASNEPENSMDEEEDDDMPF